MKKYYVIPLILGTVFLTGCNNKKALFEYKYEDNNVPGTKYEITLYEDNKLEVKETPHCNYENCKDKTQKHTTTLTKEEVDKVNKITKENDYNKEQLTISLSSIVKEDSEKASLKKDGEENWNRLYKEYDSNNDKVVTYREYGKYILSKLLEEDDK